MSCCRQNVDDLFVEIEIDGLCRRIGREIENDRERRWDTVPYRLLYLGEEVEFRAHRNMAYRGASHDEAKGVDRIARVRDKDDVAGRGDRLREVGEALPSIRA